jgi:Malic enzyme, NAD binding domain
MVDAYDTSAEDSAKWTKGRGIFASGSPFPNAVYEGKEIVSSQRYVTLCSILCGYGQSQGTPACVVAKLF